jgi:hypothetical protein
MTRKNITYKAEHRLNSNKICMCVFKCETAVLVITPPIYFINIYTNINYIYICISINLCIYMYILIPFVIPADTQDSVYMYTYTFMCI